ncbi:MAG: hypothetical protein IPL39_12790 [Opitutaceae bacterium]|nr:hypothetical protein [Opitutaceae bacterium]
MHLRVTGIITVFLIAACSAMMAVPPPPFSAVSPGQHLLERPWIGEERTTVRTGFYAKHDGPADPQKVERRIRFDLLTITETKWPRNPPGSFYPEGTLVLSRSVGRDSTGWSQTDLHHYLSALPSDAAIKVCPNVAALIELLGWWDHADGAPYNAQWSLFTITASNTIETLSVSCGAEHWSKDNKPIDALEVRRGIARQTSDAKAEPSHQPPGTLESLPSSSTKAEIRHP